MFILTVIEECYCSETDECSCEVLEYLLSGLYGRVNHREYKLIFSSLLQKTGLIFFKFVF